MSLDLLKKTEDENDYDIKTRLKYMQENMAKNIQNISSVQDWLSWNQKKQTYIPEKLDILDTQLFIGFKTPEYNLNEVVAPDFSIISDEGGVLRTKARTFIIAGEKGSGKSILASIIGLDNFVYKYHLPTLIIDPNPTAEWYVHKNSILSIVSSSVKKQIESFVFRTNQEIRKYKCVVYKPSFNSSFEEEGVDKNYVLTLQDFKDLYRFSKVDGVKALADILEVSNERASESMIVQILANENFKTFNDVLDAIENRRKTFREINNEELKITGRAFSTYLRSAILMGAVSPDLPDEKNNILEDMLKNDFVVFRSKTKGSNSDDKIMDKYYTYIKIILLKILNDRVSFVSGKGSTKINSKLNSEYGIQIIIDEIDTLAPANQGSVVAQIIQELATKYRKAGVNLIGITQDLATVDETLQKQADGILMSQINTEGNIRALKNKGFEENVITIMKRLPKEKVNIFGFKISKWCFITPQKQLIFFYPTLSLSAFKI